MRFLAQTTSAYINELVNSFEANRHIDLSLLASISLKNIYFLIHHKEFNFNIDIEPQSN